MTQLRRLPVLALAIAFVACSPFAPGSSTAGVSTAVAISPLVSTAVSGSGSVGTVEPLVVTLRPPDYTPPPSAAPAIPIPIPSIAGGLGPTELKYRLLGQFPDLFFCDPDYYPVARMDELELAIQRFPEIQANVEEFNAILAHSRLAGLSSFSDEQKLLVYQEHKKLAAIRFVQAAEGYQFQLQSARAEGNGELVNGLIDSQGAISIQETQPIVATCPICLAEGVRIDTPAGAIPVESLRVGMPVWTLDRGGLRIVTVIVRISKTVVPAGHSVVHLALNDGRELWVSPGHPIGDGGSVGQLRVGDFLDGARVISIERIPYSGYATYDLLPAGETGYYWANGVILASTLKGNTGP
jgi:hypothetical protein